MKKQNLFFIVLVIFALLTFGCQGSGDSATDKLEKATEEVKETVEETVDEVQEEAADTTKEEGIEEEEE